MGMRKEAEVMGFEEKVTGRMYQQWLLNDLLLILFQCSRLGCLSVLPELTYG